MRTCIKIAITMIQTFIIELIAAGVSERDIAARIGVTQPSINRMRNGKQQPTYEVGKKIADLYEEVCGNKGAK